MQIWGSTPCPLKGEFTNFFIGPSDVPRYDTIWTENDDVIDSFRPEILTFKDCSKHVQHVFDTIQIGLNYDQNNSISVFLDKL